MRGGRYGEGKTPLNEKVRGPSAGKSALLGL